MSLETTLRKGDYIRAAAKTGCVIEGQADRDMGRIGFAALGIVVQGDGGEPTTITINVNYWDVTVTRRNLIREGS